MINGTKKVVSNMPKVNSGLESSRYGDEATARESYGDIVRDNEPREIDPNTQTYGGWKEAFPDSNADWKDFTDSFGHQISREDWQALMHSWEGGGGHPWGYVQTGNSFRINEMLYNPDNEGKTDEEIFKNRDDNGKLRDLMTVKALNKAIANGRTPANAVFTRFAGYTSIKAQFGLTDAQIAVLRRGGNLSSSELKQLNDAMRGSRSISKSYTSTSANRKMNVFTGKPIERKLYVPKGTHAFAAERNRAESEVVFGRNVETVLMGITISPRGNLIFHERFVGYRRKK